MDRAANESSLTALLEHREEFVRFAARRASRDDAEDVVQGALLRAARKMGQLKEPQQVVSWFYVLLKHELADHHSRARSQSERLQEFANGTNVVAPDVRDSCPCSLQLLGRLPPRYAEVLRRVDQEDEGLAQVGRALGITVNNVAVRLHRARKALRDELFASCGTTSSRACLSCRCQESHTRTEKNHSEL